ncbi:CBS domain-containing protein [Owenweeksia hongkongensis DSM 17368]|uniref:CBS domain-containing protein n=2 Tax=Owenweeksia TaxID=267986 RepID=G8R5V9_OWEHD|nr:CBS domain-containing protein [Owenweeksia hongkongensis DSM 17368]
MTIVAIIIMSLLFSAFFSGVEIAFVSSNKFHIEIENKKGNFAYQLLSQLVKKPSRFIATMLVGNNIALVIYGMFMPELLNPYLEAINPYIGGFFSNEYALLLVQTLISTILILVIAEFLPKAIFNTFSTRLLEVFALPSYIFYWLFYLIVSLMIGVSNFVMKYILRAGEEQGKQAFDKVDLDNYVRERTESSSQHEDEEDPEIQIFRNALGFSEQKAREFMIPRTEIIAMDVEADLASLTENFIESNLSKILIYKESVDNIIGYVHSFELFKKPKDIRSILRPVSFIPESMTANEILNSLIKDRRSIAVVLDEFGGTSGLITVEDVVEELFGEIDDEHDVEDLIDTKISDTEFRFSARQEIDYINEKYNLELPESDNYNTLGGLILNHLESIPEKGEVLYLEPFTMKMEDVSNSKIEIVHLKVTNE